MDAATGTAITSVASTVGVVLVAWIAYKQAKLNKTLDLLEKNTNSIKDALVASTAKASHAEGVADGKAQEKANPT